MVKHNLFARLLLLFATIVAICVVTLCYFMFYLMSRSVISSELDKQQRTIDVVDSYLAGKYEDTRRTMEEIYRSDAVSKQLALLLQHPFQEYLAHRLDQYFSETTDRSANIMAFFRNKMDGDATIDSMMLYSAEQQFLYIFRQFGSQRLINTNAALSYVPDVMSEERSPVSASNIWIAKTVGREGADVFSVRVPINDKMTFRNIGQLLALYDRTAITAAIDAAGEEAKGYVLAVAADGQVLFDSSGQYDGPNSPFFGEQPLQTVLEQFRDNAYVTTVSSSQAGYTVIGIAPKAEIAATYAGLRQTLFGVALVGLLLAIGVPGLFIVNYSKRTNRILRLMRKVEGGDLAVRSTDLKGDEIGQISRGINDMLEQLERYIDRVYKAEIRQKHTELEALQARVNPHFLYNTLEVIRMRALSHGAKDVGEMIYSLSVLFKNAVRHELLYRVEDEMEACRLYLELFRIRYKNRFTYHIEWDPALAGKKMLKLSVQPLVENYIVHGLRPHRDDNRVEIRATLEDGVVRIAVEDNGAGIPPERLLDIMQQINLPEEAGKSFGLRSVHDRIKLVYGSEYGIEIKSGEAGTTVAMSFPATEEGELKHV